MQQINGQSIIVSSMFGLLRSYETCPHRLVCHDPTRHVLIFWFATILRDMSSSFCLLRSYETCPHLLVCLRSHETCPHLLDCYDHTRHALLFWFATILRDMPSYFGLLRYYETSSFGSLRYYETCPHLLVCYDPTRISSCSVLPPRWMDRNYFSPSWLSFPSSGKPLYSSPFFTSPAPSSGWVMVATITQPLRD